MTAPMMWLGITYLCLASLCLVAIAIPWWHERRDDRAVTRERYCTRPCHRRWNG